MWDFKKGTKVKIKKDNLHFYDGCDGIIEKAFVDRYMLPLFEVFIYAAGKSYLCTPQEIEKR